MRIRPLLVLPLLASLALSSACKKKEDPKPEVKQEAFPVEPPVPSPDGIVAEVILKAPDAVMQSLRTISPLVPDKASPVLADMLHVSKEVGEQVDGTKPAYVVLVRRGPESSFVFAAPLKDPKLAMDALSKGTFTKSDDQSLQLSVFEGTGTPKSQVLGIRRNYLLASSSVLALKELAPFVTRTMPSRALPKEDVLVTIPQSAVRTTLKDTFKAVLDAGAARRKEMLAKAKAGAATGPKGAPIGAVDAFGDYTARQNERVIGWLADAGDAHFSLSTVGGAISIKADVAIAASDSNFGKTVAGWPVGDALATLEVPASAVVAFGARSSEAARADSSKDLTEMLVSSFPDDVTPADKTKIETFLAAWDKSRSELTTGALLYEGPAKLGIVARLGAKDPVALSGLMKDAFGAVFAIKGVASGLSKEGMSAPTFSKDKVAGIDAHILALKLPRKPGEKLKPGEPESAEIVWGPAVGPSGEVDIAAGVGARDLLTMLVEAKGPKALHANAALTTQMTALGNSLAGSAILLPTRALPMTSGAPVTTTAPPNDPIVLAIGRGPSGPYVSIDLSKPAVELAGRFAMGAMMGGGGGGGKKPF